MQITRALALIVAVVFPGLNIDIVNAECTPAWSKRPEDPTYALEQEDVLLEWVYTADDCKVSQAKWGTGTPTISRSYFSHGVNRTDLSRFNVGVETEWKEPGTLILKNISVVHQLNYGCEVAFVEGNQLQSYVFLRVVGTKPTLSHPLPDTRVQREGDGPISFEILAESYPAPQIYWRKNDKEMPDSPNYEVLSRVVGQNSKNETIVRSTFTIKTVRRDDRAKFTARVAYGKTGPFIDTNMDFDVQYPPTTATFYTNLTSGTTFEGDSVLFTCTSDANPPPTYNIYKNSKVLMKLKNGVFLLTSVNRSDSGTYECEPENSIRSGVRLDLNVTVIGRSVLEKRVTTEEKIWLYVLIGCVSLLVLVLLGILLVIGVKKKRRRRSKHIPHSSKSNTQVNNQSASCLKPKNSGNGFHNPGYIPEQSEFGRNENHYIKQE